ncbi:hypothetical protein J9A39_27515, partial [Klebsiella pneumoniae]
KKKKTKKTSISVIGFLIFFKICFKKKMKGKTIPIKDQENRKEITVVNLGLLLKDGISERTRFSRRKISSKATNEKAMLPIIALI